MSTKLRKFVVIEGGLLHPNSPENGSIEVGTIVYLCIEPDYGTAIEDTLFSKRVHISVTLDEKGGYPFFTIEKSRLKEFTGGDLKH